MYEERARVVAAVAAGRSLRSVGQRFDVSPRTAKLWFLATTPVDAATVAAALSVLSEGWTVRDTAEAADVPRWLVRKWQRCALAKSTLDHTRAKQA